MSEIYTFLGTIQYTNCFPTITITTLEATLKGKVSAVRKFKMFHKETTLWMKSL